MNHIILSFLIAFLAGISTLFGILPTFISLSKQNKVIAFSLAFSAGVMIIVSFFSLIPEAFHYLNTYLSFPIILIFLIFFVLGIILSLSIDTTISKRFNNNTLYRLGIVSVFALVLHNIPEGVTTFITTSNNIKLGVMLSIAIALHNIPEGIAIAVPIYYATSNRLKALIYTTISGFSELLGAILAYLFLSKYITPFLMFVVLTITSGIMIHISFVELLPNSISYTENRYSLLGILLGCFVMFICIFLVHI